jgi:nitrate/nitrite transport system substrate-binding protein
MDLNGNGITVSNEVWGMMKPGLRIGPDGRPEHPIKANSLKPVIEKFRVEGRPFKMGMVSPVSTHNYELRYWLAAGGLHPGYYDGPSDVSGQIAADVLLSVIPPPQMPASLEAGTINGYCVGAPWNQQAVFKGVGVPVITDYEIWKNNPEKVFGLRADFIEQYPNTALGLTKALIRAAIWLDADGNANRGEAATILARPEYVGVDAEVIARSMTGTFEYEKGDRRAVPDFNVFFRYFATYPYLLRRGLVPHTDAALGADLRGQARRVVRGNRSQGLPSRSLSSGSAAAGEKMESPGRGFPLGQRRLPRAGGVFRRHRVRRPPTQRVPRPICDRTEER